MKKKFNHQYADIYTSFHCLKYRKTKQEHFQPKTFRVITAATTRKLRNLPEIREIKKILSLIKSDKSKCNNYDQ